MGTAQNRPLVRLLLLVTEVICGTFQQELGRQQVPSTMRPSLPTLLTCHSVSRGQQILRESPLPRVPLCPVALSLLEFDLQTKVVIFLLY